MTFAQLLRYLNTHSTYAVLHGDVAQTLAEARSQKHPDPLMGEIINLLFAGTDCTTENSPVSRAQAANSLGPLRLRFMRDDAPVTGIRMVEKIIHTIDGAFNDEALNDRFGQ